MHEGDLDLEALRQDLADGRVTYAAWVAQALVERLAAERQHVAALERAVDALLRINSVVREGEWCGICGARDTRTYSGLCLMCQVYTMPPAEAATVPVAERAEAAVDASDQGWVQEAM